jgi:serine protease
MPRRSLIIHAIVASSLAAGLCAHPASADEPSDGEWIVPGEIAIDVRDDASASDIAAIAAEVGAPLRPNSAWSVTHDQLEIADVGEVRMKTALDVLSRDPRVESAEPMALYRVSFVPNDPLYESKQWHLQRVGAGAAWNYTCGRGVTVAVVDTGIACFDSGPFSRGSDLGGTRCEGGWNFVDDSPEAFDDQGHGTHVAGTVAQTTNNGVGTAGLAFCATLLPVKVLGRQGFGRVTNVAEGIRFAVDGGAQVINLSLGGPTRSRIVGDAVRYALDRGVVVVAAAGNTGRRVGWPAAIAGVIAVSATDSDDNLASFSSRGPEIVIAAPGVAITQQTICNGGRDRCELFATFDGTSMASPHVAAAAAMVMSLGMTDPDHVRAVLTGSARKRAGRDQFGAGIVDIGAATARVYAAHVLLRGLALGLFSWLLVSRIRKGRARLVQSASAWLAALVAAVGLLPLGPLLGFVRAHPGGLSVLADLASRPLGEWDIVLWGTSVHKGLLLASSIPALVLSAFGFADRRVRPIVGGLALGSAALLAQIMWSGDVAFVGGPCLLRLWAGGNILVCAWLARTALATTSPNGDAA